MALIYKATLKPSKLELLTAWLPTRPWFPAGADVKQVGAYRFDDPAGEVGIETFLLQADDGSVLQVPLTYRAAPLDEADEFLVGSSEHSVLGVRWVYDGCADPVWAAELATAIRTGGTQVEEYFEVDGRREHREPTASVKGSGTGSGMGGGTGGGRVEIADGLSCHDEGAATVVRAGALELVVARVVGTEISASETLTGSWSNGGPAVLAGLRTV